MDLLALLPVVQAYLGKGVSPDVPDWDPAHTFDVSPLAQGEYNLNYTVQQGGYVPQGDSVSEPGLCARPL